jgi:putative membrane-bound dehydrogenase-like protein
MSVDPAQARRIVCVFDSAADVGRKNANAPKACSMKRFVLLLGIALVSPVVRAEDKPLSLGEAARRMTLPTGFKATLFAGEPDVVQPIAFTFDDRGRLWVVECTSYPQWTKEKEGKDRVLIFEDTDNDGHFDKCTVFYDKGANLTGIELGFGGVWLCATPNLLFIPIKPGEDKPAGPPEVVLDGWDLTAKHNVFNGLRWGPDGWLYGCNGILSNSKVGKPGTPDAERVSFNCGVWRYHPTRKEFEVVAHGTTNPWGLDFDDYGQMFITNCVIKHLWHVVPGAHYQRMFGQDINPYSYGLMESCADHIHWAGGDWTTSRGGQGAHSDAGGGHAHSGAMIYLGDNWPSEYRNNVFTCNIHGNRVNRDILERKRSGYVAHHGKDFLFANDPWFRGIAIHQGPDGSVFVSDWTDTGECHNYEVVDRTNGRIYKIVHGQTTPFTGDLAKLSDAELIKLQLHKNEWLVRHSRRLLQERAAAGKLEQGASPALWAILNDSPDVTRKLRALWALHVINGLDEKGLLTLLDHSEEFVRAWSIALLLEGRRASKDVRDKLATLAAKDPSPLVRLHLASGLQRLPVRERGPIGMGLLQHAEDADDPSLPLMIWYGVEPLAVAGPERTAALLERMKIPLVREFFSRRIASLPAKEADDPTPGLHPLLDLLGRVSDPGLQHDVIAGILKALEGRRQEPMSKEWPDANARLAKSKSAEIREDALLLGAVFEDAEAMESLRKIVTDPSAVQVIRERALQTLVFKQKPELLPLLQDLLNDKLLRGAAVRGLAAFHDEKTPRLILARYGDFKDAEKADAVQTLSSRPAYALALLDAVEKCDVPRTDLSAFTARQLVGLKDKTVTERVTKVLGAVRPASEGKAALMAKYKALLTPDYVKRADLSQGRVVFQRTCATCHRLFDEGASIGPELTGSQRANLDYFLENVLDPSAVVAKEYQMTVLELKSGRFLNGIIKDENDRSITLQTQNELIVVPKDDIESRKPSAVSLMPDGLLDKLSKEEVRDLAGYLASPRQSPLPKQVPK